MLDSLGAHYDAVIDAFMEGEVIPFLGAGVNLCGRPPGTDWQQAHYLPSGTELAAYLAAEFGYPSNDKQDLVRVSQYATVMRGSGPLYRRLQQVFAAEYPPTSLHHFLATLPATLRERGCLQPYQLIVTTNYDDLLERAFEAAGEPCDLVSYVAAVEQRGKFWHVPHGDTPRLIDKPNEYLDLPLGQRTVILKIHGAMDRAGIEQSSFVITEDDYIDYLARMNTSSPLPKTLAARMKQSGFLFLGYSLRDWNLRVILHRIWGEQKLTYSSWAIQLDPEDLDRKYWMKRDVEILNVQLEQYITGLSERVQSLPRVAGAP